MQFLQIVKLVLTLLPLILDTVKAIEVAMPDGGKGEQKLALVRSVIEAAYNASADAIGAFEQVWPVLSKAVTAAVNLFNAAGVFKKG